jgi:hypothetical protein
MRNLYGLLGRVNLIWLAAAEGDWKSGDGENGDWENSAARG